jgi:hypothetical protein
MPSNPTTQQDPVEENCARWHSDFGTPASSTKAAGVPTLLAENKQQQARIEELEGALRPFVDAYKRCGYEWIPDPRDGLELAHFDAATLALSPTQPDAPEGQT